MTPDTLDLDVDVLLDDQVRCTEWLLDRPELRRRRLLVGCLIAVCAPLLGPMLGVGSAAWDDHEPIATAFVSAVSDPSMLRMVATVTGLLLACFGVIRLFRKPLLRRRLRRMLVERPGVDPTDPTLAERARFTIGPDGFASHSVGGVAQVNWTAIKSLEDAGSVMILKTGRLTGYVIPKRCVSADQLVALDSIVRAGLAMRRIPAAASEMLRPHGTNACPQRGHTQ